MKYYHIIVVVIMGLLYACITTTEADPEKAGKRQAKETFLPMKWSQRVDISKQCAVVIKTTPLDSKAKTDPDRMIRKSIEVHYLHEDKTPKIKVIKSYEAKMRNASLGFYTASRKFNTIALLFQQNLSAHVLLYNEKTQKLIEHKKIFETGGDSGCTDIHSCKIVWSMTSPYLWLASVSSTIELWNIRTGKKLLIHEEPPSLINEVIDCYSRSHK